MKVCTTDFNQLRHARTANLPKGSTRNHLSGLDRHVFISVNLRNSNSLSIMASYSAHLSEFVKGQISLLWNAMHTSQHVELLSAWIFLRTLSKMQAMSKEAHAMIAVEANPVRSSAENPFVSGKQIKQKLNLRSSTRTASIKSVAKCRLLIPVTKTLDIWHRSIKRVDLNEHSKSQVGIRGSGKQLCFLTNRIFASDNPAHNTFEDLLRAKYSEPYDLQRS